MGDAAKPCWLVNAPNGSRHSSFPSWSNANSVSSSGVAQAQYTRLASATGVLEANVFC